MGIVTVEKLENADKDADALEKFIEGEKTEFVKTRKNKQYPTLENAVYQVIETGGFEPFATEAELLASTPILEKKAAKALDTKKVWLWDGEWIDTGSSEFDLAKVFTENKISNTNLDFNAIVHDRLGNKFYLSLVNSEKGVMPLGFSEKLIQLFSTQIKLDESGFSIQDENGRTALKINGKGKLVYPILNQTKQYTRPQLKQLPKLDFVHLVGNGQSLGDGSTSNSGETATGQFISTVQVGGNLTIKSGATSIPELASYDASALVPLVSMQAVGKSSSNESPIINSANSFTRRMKIENQDYLLNDWQVVATYGGKGGQSIETLSASTLFTQLKKQITDVSNLLSDKNAGVYFYQYHGNESQYNVIKNTGATDPFGTTTADPLIYENKLLAHFDNVVEHIVDTYNQDFLPYLLLGHQVNQAVYGIRRNTIAISQWRMSRKYDFVILAVPVYRFRVNTKDFQHLHHDQSWLLGEYNGRAQAWTLTKGKWRPLEPTKVDWQQNHIDVEFFVPFGELKLDGEAMYNNIICPNFGFDVWTDETVLDSTAISSIEITSKNSIRINLAHEITADTALLTYGRGRDGDIVSGGNLRDTHGDVDQVTAPVTNTTYKMHNPCVMFQYSKMGGF